MAIERRDFIKSGFAGLSAGLLRAELAQAQGYPGKGRGEFEGGTSSVRLEGRLKSGVLKMEAQEFSEGRDRFLVVNGRLGAIDLYCSMFRYNDEETVSEVLRSNGHTTSVVLSKSDDPNIGHLVVWNDTSAPNTFRIDKDKFLETQKFKEAILDGKGDSLDLIGGRNPPAFTFNELEGVFGDNDALKEFMRGHTSRHELKAPDKLEAFICHLFSSIGGSLVGPFWAAS